MSKIKNIAACVALAIFMAAGVAFATSDAPTGSGMVNRVYGIFKSSPSTLADGDYDALRLDYLGRLRVGVEFGAVGSPVTASAWAKHSISAINATPTALTVAAAPGVSHCLTSLDFSNFHDATGTITVATGFTLAVYDGPYVAGVTSNRLWATTLSWPAVAGGNSNHFQRVFPTPLKSTAGNSLVFTCGDTAALAHTGEAISMQGYSTK